MDLLSILLLLIENSNPTLIDSIIYLNFRGVYTTDYLVKFKGSDQEIRI